MTKVALASWVVGICLSLSSEVRAWDCANFLKIPFFSGNLKVAGALIARPSQKFSARARANLWHHHQEVLDSYRADPQRPERAKRIRSLMSELAENAGLQKFLRDRPPVEVIVLQTRPDENWPIVRMESGVLVVNELVLDACPDFSTLAALAGVGLTHYVLGHSDQISAFHTSGWISRLSHVAQHARRDDLASAQELEMDRAVPYVLQSSGINPWYFPQFFRFWLAATADMDLDENQRYKLEYRTFDIEDALTERGMARPLGMLPPGDSAFLNGH